MLLLQSRRSLLCSRRRRIRFVDAATICSRNSNSVVLFNSDFVWFYSYHTRVRLRRELRRQDGGGSGSGSGSVAVVAVAVAQSLEGRGRGVR